MLDDVDHAAPEGYRQPAFGGPCHFCSQGRQTLCVRCARPLCSKHAPKRNRRCSHCEDQFAIAFAGARTGAIYSVKRTSVILGIGSALFLGSFLIGGPLSMLSGFGALVGSVAYALKGPRRSLRPLFDAETPERQDPVFQRILKEATAMPLTETWRAPCPSCMESGKKYLLHYFPGDSLTLSSESEFYTFEGPRRMDAPELSTYRGCRACNFREAVAQEFWQCLKCGEGGAETYLQCHQLCCPRCEVKRNTDSKRSGPCAQCAEDGGRSERLALRHLSCPACGAVRELF